MNSAVPLTQESVLGPRSRQNELEYHQSFFKNHTIHDREVRRLQFQGVPELGKRSVNTGGRGKGQKKVNGGINKGGGSARSTGKGGRNIAI